MKVEQSRGLSLALLCLLFGYSRQAYYKRRVLLERKPLQEELIIQQVLQIRRLQPRIGSCKLYLSMQGFTRKHALKIGRDAFRKLLGKYDLLNKRRRGKIRTTDSGHWLKKHPNLIKELVPTACDQLWVSDITGIQLRQGDAFVSLVTDAYSRKIIGFHISKTLAAEGTVRALEMAIGGRSELPGLIHHSDRGVQYCCNDYIRLLNHHKIGISMTESGDPRDNAIAERVNGILKMELLEPVYQDLQTARSAVEQAVSIYNYIRPHSSISMLVPALVHGRDIPVKRRWKNYYRTAAKNCSDVVINKSGPDSKRKKEAKKEKTHQDVDNATRSPHPDTINKQIIT